MIEYLKTPFIPEKKVKTVIIDGRADKEVSDELAKENIDVIYTAPLNELYSAVCGHPDMMLHPICDNTIVVAPEAYHYFEKNLSRMNFKLIKGNSHLKSNYPENIAYNVARINNIAIHNTKYTDIVIQQYFENLHIKMIHVKQGYSKCSICIVNENAIITSDHGIAKAADDHNMDVLRIRHGHITLKGLAYGFIGGAAGLVSENILVTAGSLMHHPDFMDIYNFCGKYGVQIKALSRSAVHDIGSVIPIAY